ncbi:MAG: permease [Coriobacteriia bacterium]|nr:permease [Coriobacteriia bacterium]MBN2822041.1 permease [Coriobacteriia bacterium]
MFAVLGSVLGWLNESLLKMTWLNELVGRFVENVLGVTLTSKLGSSLQFFIYDTVKIFVLLSTLIFVISYVQSYFPPERTKAILGRFNGITGMTLGALLGTITPFCSCSSIPLFIGFTSAGLPLGVTFAFLISSPLVDLASVLLLASIFNWSIALAYVVVGLVLAVIGGFIISHLKLERYVEPFVFGSHLAEADLPELTRADRLAYARDQAADVVRKVWLYVLIGVGIGATIHGWIPDTFISAVLGDKNPFAVIIAAGVGVPMYADIFGTLPIAEALVGKGVGLGTVLAFMMAVTALSLPSLIMLKKVVKTPLLATFFGIVVTGIIIIGYTFNAVGQLFI